MSFSPVLVAPPGKNDTQEYIQRYIETNKNNHRDTIRAWIKNQGVLELDFIEILSLKSDSNFMYLHHALPAIAKGQYDDLSLNDFPIGLKDYYDRHWKRMNMQDKSKEIEIFVLFILLKNNESPTVKIITNAIKGTANFPELEELDIKRILESWVEFLTKKMIQGEARYSIYHASFADFLTKTKDEVAENRKIFKSVIQGISKSTYGNMDELIGL